MAMPLAPNTTCDIFRFDKSPPDDDPNEPGVRVHLTAEYAKGLEMGETRAKADIKFTHIMLVEPDLDIRDDFKDLVPTVSQSDKVFIPDEDGTEYVVVHVNRQGKGTATDHKRVYLRRISTL